MWQPIIYLEVNYVCELEHRWYLLSIMIHDMDWRLANTLTKSPASP